MIRRRDEYGHTVPTKNNQDEPYLCDCGMTFDSTTDLNEHTRQNTGKESLKPPKRQRDPGN